MKYIFRGYEVFDYNPKTKKILTIHQDGLCNFNFCSFIPEDYKLLAQFFETCYKHTQHGDAIDLTDIVVD